MKTEMTHVEAAKLLNVSEGFMAQLLMDNAIESRRIGDCYIVKRQDVLTYKSADDKRRKEAADELAAIGQEWENEDQA